MWAGGGTFGGMGKLGRCPREHPGPEPYEVVQQVVVWFDCFYPDTQGCCGSLYTVYIQKPSVQWHIPLLLQSPEGLRLPQGKWVPNPGSQGQRKSLVRPELKRWDASQWWRSWSSIPKATLLSTWGGLVGVRRTREICKGEASAVQGSGRGNQCRDGAHVQILAFWQEEFRL